MGYIKYRNWAQIDEELSKYGFSYVKADLYTSSFKFDINSTRKFWGIYKLSK